MSAVAVVPDPALVYDVTLIVYKEYALTLYSINSSSSVTF